MFFFRVACVVPLVLFVCVLRVTSCGLCVVCVLCGLRCVLFVVCGLRVVYGVAMV